VAPALVERVSSLRLVIAYLEGMILRALGSGRSRVTLTRQGTGPLNAHSCGSGRALRARLFRRRSRARSGRRGGGRDGLPRLFGCRTAMITRALIRCRGARLSAVYAATCS
jgi:hypothetical protein